MKTGMIRNAPYLEIGTPSKWAKPYSLVVENFKKPKY
jgi:hypothetical protein